MTPRFRALRMLNIFLLVGALLILGWSCVAWYGSSRSEARTRALRSDLMAARAPVAERVVRLDELEGLPEPVQRFFRAVLAEGQSPITEVRLRHTGTFNMSETTEQWKAFTSDQLVVIDRPGFDWDGRIAMLPGLPVRVHDTYVAGEGILHASVLGAFTVADVRGGGELAEGELMRFVGEAAWYPTALLPGGRVTWTPVDDRSAMATMTDGGLSVSLRFTFREDGTIDSVFAESRARMADGSLIPTPWQGRFWNYEQRAGFRVPVDGEVAWLLPDGPKPYWRGHLMEIVFRLD